MRKKKKIDLAEKGWSDKDIKKAASILEKAESYDKHFSKIVFWSALIVIIFANLVVSLILIPFLVVLSQVLLYFVIVLLAGSIGFLYNLLITDIQHLEKKHHVAASIIIPILAIANLIAVILMSNKFMEQAQVNNLPHNPIIMGIVFVAAFILPYLVGKLIKK